MDRLESVPEWIRSVIEQRITDGHLEPGDRIGLKSELQAEFRVAGPTLDQALKLLANDGLVSLRRGRRVVSSSPSLNRCFGSAQSNCGRETPSRWGRTSSCERPSPRCWASRLPGPPIGTPKTSPNSMRSQDISTTPRSPSIPSASSGGGTAAAEARRQRDLAFDLPEPPRCSRGSDHRCGLPRHRARSLPGASTDRGACQLVPRSRRRRHRARPGVRRGRENRLTAGSRWSSCHHRIGVAETSLGDGRIRRQSPQDLAQD